MRFSIAFSVLEDLRLGFKASFMPAILAILKSPLLLFRPSALKRLMFFEVWKRYGGCADQGGTEVKKGLITPYAGGVVLDLGAGLGHTARYLDLSKVTKYIALEPNTLMHEGIRKEAAPYGFTESSGTLQLLSCGAEDTETIVSEIGGQVDTLISILMLCSVPNPKKTIETLMDKVLKPGGQFLFYEHVANRSWEVRVWQYLWTPIWAMFFDGCALNRPTDVYIRNLTCWKAVPEVMAEGDRVGTWGKEGEDLDSLFFHQVGRFIKKD
ncbi:hypothetical protein M422DRAFT_163342 [Sphaerobolus stellatus SS14]|uniref:Methyltransferase type 11 domain-containing protein n=1 Tax=Sphaerobolus stellatus (strain SS14) TaxID=990650 RepID=A0A0C9W5T0_SPHS4|nr:hypothetical protein M422DRAFT_163342 [Sphaerobolus stellatus SS14]